MDIALAALAGVLVVLSMSINSALGLRVGVFRATAVNYAVGLAGVVVLAALTGFAVPTFEKAIPWWAWTGGVLGVGIVAASNLVLPRIPVATATILVVAGQLGTGLLLDAVREGNIPLPRLAGAALLLAGILLSRAKPDKTSEAKTE